MKFGRYLIIAVLLVAFLASCASPKPSSPSASVIASVPTELLSQLPAAEQGFEWKFYKGVVFQKPLGWQEREKYSDSNGFPFYVYSASGENFSDTKMFEMGVTVQYMNDSKKLKNIEAEKVALMYLKPLIESHKKEEILLVKQTRERGYQNIYFRFRDAPVGLKPIIVHKFIMASNEADHVYILTFESPESEWEENWKKYGTPIMKKVSPVFVGGK